jgi:hypothetical protein
VTILPAGAAGALADLVVVVAFADLLAAGLVMDFFDTAMVFPRFRYLRLKSVDCA